MHSKQDASFPEDRPELNAIKKKRRQNSARLKNWQPITLLNWHSHQDINEFPRQKTSARVAIHHTY